MNNNNYIGNYNNNSNNNNNAKNINNVSNTSNTLNTNNTSNNLNNTNNSSNLILSFKKPHNKTILAMKNTINSYYSKNNNANNNTNNSTNNSNNNKANIPNNNNYNFNELFDELKEKISTITSHDNVEILNRGNSAILLAMASFTGSIFIPDQGAWRGFKQAGKVLNKELIQFSTDLGLIDIESLEDVFIENNIKDNKNKKKTSAIFLTSFAGYTAEQNIKEISKLAMDYGIAIVEDASGAINDPKGNLANGKYSDIIIVSTGSPKIINVGSGAIITAKSNNIFKENPFLTKTLKADIGTVAGINTEIDFAQESLKKALASSKYIKNNLNNISNVIHSNKRGINVIIKNNLNEFWNLKKELSVIGGSMITKCPSYDRVKEKAISIEIKNLDINCLNKDNLNNIIMILDKYNI
ncbi:MAG: DegT/DnrJ/EryC1/StrS family aminotransferase [Methanobacteriaceae archaeon]